MLLERCIFSLYPLLYLVALKQAMLFEMEYSLRSINLGVMNEAVPVGHVAELFFQHL